MSTTQDTTTGHLTIANERRVVEIAANGRHGDKWIACYFIEGAAVRSKSFKTVAGAMRWAHLQVRARNA